ncbi:MAG: bifunctional riboflavin kinase/FAD synthetase [Anaerocolumna sp.]
MEYITGRVDFKLHNTVVSLGKFDGIHRGHQLLLNKILDQKRKGYQAVMFTFMFHPNNLFSDKEIDTIYTEDEKRYLLDQSGLDVLVSYPFTEETASMEPENFIKNVLIEKLDAKMIVVGSDFCFGHNRKGNVAMLKEKSEIYGYELIVFDKIKLDGQVISSSYIRGEIMAGNMEKANSMLGKPFTIIGEVQHGRKIGRTLGFPTVNLIPPAHKLLPPNGVYASVTNINGKYPGVTNIGFNPTVGTTQERRVETYIFDFDTDLYGASIELSLYCLERSEVKFNSLEELKVQMQKDIAFGRKYFSGHEF